MKFPRTAFCPTPVGNATLRLLTCCILQALATGALAQQEARLTTVEVVSTTPLDGLGVELNQIPANVLTLKADTVGQQSPTNLADLLNNNLGPVSVSGGTGNPYQNDVAYRGFQATSLLGAPVGLSVYFDGVRMNEPFGSIVNWDLIPTNAISSVHIEPGSNPLFGLNTLGGAVVTNTKNGADDPGTHLQAMGGSFQRRALSLESGWADAERHTDHFVALNLDRQDGYRNHSGSDVRQFFGKSRWHSDDRRTDLELSGALADTMLQGTQSLPMSMISNPKSAYTYPDHVANRMGLLNLKASHWADDNHFLTGNLYVRRSDSSSANSNAQLDDGCYDSSGNVTAQCTNITGGTGTAPNGVATNPLGLARYTGDINTSMVYSQTRQSTLGSSLQWSSLENWAGHDNNLTLGGTADLSYIRYGQSTVLGQLVDYQVLTTPNQRYWFPSTNSTSGSNMIDAVALSSNTRNLSLFASDKLSVNDRLTLSASGSYNIAVVNQRGQNSQYLNQDGGYSWTDGGVSYYNPGYVGAQYYKGSTLTTITPAMVSGKTAGPEVGSLDGNHLYRRFNPSVGFNFNPSPTLGVFGHYSESMRAPTSIELSCADPARPCALPTGFNGDPDLKAVVARTLELGARGRLSPQVSWNAAAYTTRTRNDIQFLASSASTGYFANVGGTQRSGLDLGVQHTSSRMQLGAALGYVRATYQSSFTTAQGVDVAPGNRIPGIPDLTLKLRGAYRFSPQFNAGLNVVAANGQYAHGDEGNNNPTGKVPGYALTHLDLHYTFDNGLQLIGLVNNLFNRRYATYGVLGTNVYTGADEQFRTPGAPRTIWVGLSYAFGGKSPRNASADRD